jgi:pimeloyl-ACP methyl ester carboxylesterase
MTGVRTHKLSAADGIQLAVHEMGDAEGRPVVLIHGLMSNARVNWIKYGTAARLVAAGFRVIMPDLRGHGDSGAPTDADAYPHDILLRDNEGIIAALGLADYDLCGFSLGARTAAKLVIEGARPRRLILAGMGLEGFTDWSRRLDYFLGVVDKADTVQRGEPGYMAAAFMRTTGIAPDVVRHIVSSVSDLAPEALSLIPMPTMVLCGTEDRDNGSPQALAEALPDGRAVEVPGNHMSCVTKPEFGRAIVDFLTA